MPFYASPAAGKPYRRRDQRNGRTVCRAGRKRSLPVPLTVKPFQIYMKEGEP